MKIPVWFVRSAMLLVFVITPSANAQTWKELVLRADSLQKLAQWDSAMVLSKQALAITEREYGREDSIVAQVVNRIGVILDYQGKRSEAEQAYRRALAILEKVHGPEHPRLAMTLSNLGLLCTEQGRLAEAEPLLQRALAIYEKVFGPEHPRVATQMRTLGMLFVEQGRYAEAESLYRQALAISEKALGQDHPLVAASLHDLATLFMVQGRYPEAEPLLLRDIEISERSPAATGPKDMEMARSLGNLANLYERQGRYAEAEPLFKRVMDIHVKVSGPEHPDVAATALGLANLYANQARYGDAEPLYRRALEIYEKAWGAEHPNVANVLNNLGLVYDDQSRYADGEQLLQRALAIYEKALGPGHPQVAMTLHNLAANCYYQSRFTEGETYCSRALTIREQVLAPDHPDIAKNLQLRAAFLETQDRHAEAATDLRRAVKIYETLLGSENPTTAKGRSHLATVYQNQGKVLEACAEERKAWRIRRGNFRDGVNVLAERNALEYSHFLKVETGNYLSSLLDAPDGLSANAEEIADVVFSAKGAVSDGIMTRYQSLGAAGGAETAALTDSLRYARFALSTLYVDGPGNDSTARRDYHSKLEAATRNKERIEAELARCSATFQSEQELWDVGANEISAALPEGGALVEFMQYDHRIKFGLWETRCIAVVVKADGQFSVFPLGAGAVIDTAVYRYRQQFRDARNLDQAAYASAAGNLYSLVWRPFAALLTGATAVFIAPDGNLNLMSFAGLKDDSGEYLIEDYPIQYLSSGRDLIRLRDKPASGSGLLAMGDPDFDLSFQKESVVASTIASTSIPSLVLFRNVRSGCQALKDLKVSRLSGTRREVEVISSRWQGSSLESAVTLLDTAATEENFKRDAPGKRVIHLATHGYYISEECQPQQTRRLQAGESEGYVGENPLLLSGFFLAGANHHADADEAEQEDGVVSAEDVAGLNLQGTDLVVLSACESGLGEVKSGEGVYGLRRAFQMAGARTVISALWPVDDKSTAEFMGQLFSAQDVTLPRTMQRAALARLASLRSQRKSDHPFYWAAFVATGDWKTE
jgi:CHAT domain-containing protein/tetratricopeptide (TPR) repeat protein